MNRIRKRYSKIILSFLLAPAFLGNVFAQGKPVWRGSRVLKGEVEVVRNPKEPLFRDEIVQFCEDLRLDTSSDPYNEIAAIRAIEVDESGNIFVLDSKNHCIHVFDSDGKLLRVIGRQGQGPGEFIEPERLYISPNGELLVWDSKQISVFSLNGDYSRGYPSSILDEIQKCAIDRDNIILGIRFPIMEKPYARELIKFDSEFRPVKVFEKYIIPPSKDNKFNPVRPIAMELGLTVAGLFLVATQDRYELRFYDSSGSLKKLILKDHENLPVTKKDKEEMLKGAPAEYVRQCRFSETFPAWHRIFCGAGDHIFVETYEQTENDRGLFYDVFDESGRYIAKTPISKGWVLHFKGGHVYLSEANEEGYHILKRMKIIWGN
jgi:hypothetical protein